MFKNRREKKLSKYQSKLSQNHFSRDEISLILPIYKKIVRLSNIFLFNIFLFLISIIMIIVAKTTKNNEITKVKNILFWVFTFIAGVLTLISFVLSFTLFFKVMLCSINEVRKKVLLWAILSLIPAISFLTFFVMKWKMSHLYKYRK